VGSGEGERGGIRFSNPGHLGRGREREREGNGRGERGARADVADVARRRRRRGRGDGCGHGGASGRGGRRETGPTGGSHLSATPGGREAGGRLGLGLRPAQQGGGGRKGGDGPAAHLTKKEEKEGKKKKKKKKDFSLELKYCLLNFNWLKLFLEL
jgi:hypothetical protein